MTSPYSRPVAGRSRSDDGLTAKQLREVALELRRHAARHADTEAKMTAFLDRADALRAEARAIERKRLTAAERKRGEKGMRGR